MKSTLCALTLALSLHSFVMPQSAATEGGGPSATGGGTFTLGERRKGRFDFSAVTHENGSVTGHITLRDPTEIPNLDVDGTGELEAEGSTPGFELTADVVCLDVSGKRGVLGGVVTSASIQRYVGLRMILTIEDNGEGDAAAAPDKLTWGVYPRVTPRLVGDEENVEAGAFLVGEKRLVTDEENPEAGAFLVGEGEFDCRSFPLSSYALTNIDGGNIQIHE